MAQQEVQQEAQQPLLLNALKEAQECIKVLIKKIESDHSFDHEFQYDESCIAELEKKLRTYQKKTSSSLDARKMYGDVAPGDTTHQNVILLYQNYFKNAFRSLPKELNTQAESKEEKYEIWKIISIIVQESFSQSREAIVTTVIGKLKKVLLTDMPITEPLDEATNDFFRAFNMYITSEIDGIKEIEKKLLSEVSEDDSCYLQQAVALTKESDPDCYYRFFQDEKGNDHHVPSIAADHGSQRDARGTSKDVKGNDNSVSTIIFSHIFGRSIKGRGLENETILNISEKLDRNIKEVKKRIKVVEKVKSLNREIEELQKEIEEMKKRATDDDALHKPSLHFEKKDLIKPWHEKYVSKLLEKLKNDLRHLLSCSSDVIIERSDARETYKIYGLLLSACKLRESKPPDAVEKVLGAIQNEDSRYSYDVSIIKGVLKGEAVKKYVQEAVDLTYKMLTLLPPLVVTVYPEEYKEELHDTNRLTWDESDESHKLIYYRPLLVYGNQLQVAARGLVGNK